MMRPVILLRSGVARLFLAALCWLAITEADPEALGYGAVAAPVVVAASYLLTGPPGARGLGPRAALAVIPLACWVMWRSVLGGVDVSRRALRLPRADIDPYWTSTVISLEAPAARVALAFIMNLMPGTLSARLDGERLAVHVISPDLDVGESLASLERRLAAVVEPGSSGPGQPAPHRSGDSG